MSLWVVTVGVFFPASARAVTFLFWSNVISWKLLSCKRHHCFLLPTLLFVGWFWRGRIPVSQVDVWALDCRISLSSPLPWKYWIINTKWNSSHRIHAHTSTGCWPSQEPDLQELRCEPRSQLCPLDSKFTPQLLSFVKSLWFFFTFYLYPGAKKYVQEKFHFWQIIVF